MSCICNVRFILGQASECKVLLDDATVMSLISDEEVRLRYQRLISNNFVQVNYEFISTTSNH